MRSKWATTGGAIVAVIGTFLTWLRSGSASRSSYELFGLVDRLGFSEASAVGLALKAWPLVPLLLVLAVVATWWSGPRWITGPLVLVAAGYPLATAIAILNAPAIGLFGVGAGPVVTLIGCGVMLVSLAVDVVNELSATRRERSTHLSGSADDRS